MGAWFAVLGLAEYALQAEAIARVCGSRERWNKSSCKISQWGPYWLWEVPEKRVRTSKKSQRKPKASVKEHSSEDDPALVRAAREGNTAAFEELMARHRDKIYARAFSMVLNEEEAIDLSQEAWVKAWQRLPQFLGEASFGTWITRIVINLCLDHLRKQKRRPTESIEEMSADSGGVERQMPVEMANPAAGMERAELRHHIDQALNHLSCEHRTVLVLHEFERMKYKDIAQTMGCSTGTVMSRLFYARRKLAALLGGLREDVLR
jgi:RNA polymerase sigma-70 factor, ECF subfamily